MPCSKAQKKRSGKQAAPRSIVQAPKSPADILPPELIHLVFTYLKPTEAAAFRWAGRIFAEIGLQYLVPTVYLALEEESYDRLWAIAEHPTVSKYVVKLVYETEGLGLIDRDQFDDRIRRTRVTPLRHDSERPGSSASARAWRAYERELVREKSLLSQDQTTQLLDRAWSMYNEYLASQKKLQQAKFFLKKTEKAIRQFQNLKSICASADGAVERFSGELTELLPNYYFLDRATYGDMSSFNPTTSVLLAAESAGLLINHFSFEPLTWSIFAQNDKDLAALNRSMLHVRRTSITLAIQRASSQSRMMSDIEFIRRECLTNGRLQTFLASAPDLECLGLHFRTRPQIYPTMKDTLGMIHWSSLKAVNLYSMSIYKHDLVGFCERHSHTLKLFSLSHMMLYDTSWDVIFHRVRQAFKLGRQLHACKLRGWFWSPAHKHYHMDSKGKDKFSLGMLVSDYIRATDIGDISLHDFYEVRGFSGRWLKSLGAGLA